MVSPGMKPYFAVSGFELYLGDALEVLEQLEPESIDVVYADPPYNLSNGGITCVSGRMVSVNKGDWDSSKGFELDSAFHRQWIEKCRRVLRRDGTIWISGTYHSIYSCGYALQSLGFQIINDICWYKPNAPPNLSTRYFTASHETVIWARKSRDSKHTFNYEDMKSGEWKGDSLKRPGKQMRSVWEIPSPSKKEKTFGKHPTQKPIELLKRVILSSTKRGETILDPFTGSSTTGMVAYAYGRKFIGVDSSQDFLDLSIKRFKGLETLSPMLKPIRKEKGKGLDRFS